MAVHAHPDDEVFGTGGVLARAHDEGIHTVLVCATRGEVGEIHDPDLDPDVARPRLGEIREQELRRACEILHVDDLRFLGYRDSGMAGTPENADPTNFQNADFQEATERLVGLIRQFRPHVVVTYDPRGSYGHPDHIMAHRVTNAAVQAAADPKQNTTQGLAPWHVAKLYESAIPREAVRKIRSLLAERGIADPFARPNFDFESFTMPDEVITTRVDVRDYNSVKRQALLAHRTQIPLDNPVMTLPADIQADVFGYETFMRVKSDVVAPDQEIDLFAGLR